MADEAADDLVVVDIDVGPAHDSLLVVAKELGRLQSELRDALMWKGEAINERNAAEKERDELKRANAGLAAENANLKNEYGGTIAVLPGVAIWWTAGWALAALAAGHWIK